ncbi:sodium/proline symporter PutP [Serinibacter salmoneus]|uniref:Sodium/proline symporter n=1 Tax=Serinibacter salmoneus TaxID=556530 RepID=A0A2A9D045_9MICO|nr:sodium/proline symporter PutP [Serinibacter salmoneus]PFG20057.1 sodium/proline symporter [Serinibacter salmoneus]
MSDQGFQIAAVVVYFALMLGIGYYAYRKTASDLGGYMLGSRGLRPSVAALSASASDMSGWLLLGLPGAIYAAGLIEAWIAIGLIIGAWLNWTYVAPRLRAYSEISDNAITIPSFFAKRIKGNVRPLRISAAIVILAFFTFYVSSGMVAAGKFFVSSFGWNYLAGMGLVAVITLAYTLFGGFLGATLTDVAQGLLMFAALIAVPIVAVVQMGGITETANAITAVNPEAFNLFAGISEDGALLWTIGLISTAAWGLGYFGQPHIIVRFMALRTPAEAKVGKRIAISWMALTAAGAIATALIGIGYFAQNPDASLADPETVFLVLSQVFFHPFVAGLVLAAVLAAIMSTMSSQLVVCSSALVEDLYNMVGKRSSDRAQLILGRVGVLAVAVVAALLALDQNAAVLDLVAFAWAGFGAAFGPIVLLSLYWKKLTAEGAMAGLVTGAIVVGVWGNVPALTGAMYEIVPGFLLNLLVAVVVSRMTAPENPGVEQEFDEMVEEVTG